MRKNRGGRIEECGRLRVESPELRKPSIGRGLSLSTLNPRLSTTK
jgi:hypothetical protein